MNRKKLKKVLAVLDKKPPQRVERVIERVIEKEVQNSSLPLVAGLVKKMKQALTKQGREALKLNRKIENVARSVFKSAEKEMEGLKKDIERVAKKLEELPEPQEIEPLDISTLVSKEELDEKIRKEKLDMIQRLPRGGGNANRQIKVDGVVMSKKYTDVNFVAGTNIVLTASDDDTDKNVDIEIVAQNDATAVWGSITGTLSNQTDLQTALDARVPYTGANDDVDLGGQALIANSVTTANFVSEGQMDITSNDTQPIVLIPSTNVQITDPTSAANIIFDTSDLTVDRTQSFQDANGTIALTSDLFSEDHTDLSNLAWTSSGHTGTASRIAAFDGAGAASLIDYSTDWLSQYALLAGRSGGQTLIGGISGAHGALTIGTDGTSDAAVFKVGGTTSATNAIDLGLNLSFSDGQNKTITLWSPIVDATANFTLLRGLNNFTRFGGSGNPTLSIYNANIAGATFFDATDINITTMRNFYAQAVFNVSSATPTIGTNYGFYIDDLTFATTNWGFYNAGSANNWLGTGRTKIGNNSTLTTSAALEVDSTTGAVLLPRMTSTQRDALTAANGMIIYNTTTGKIEGREGGAWVDI